MGNVFFAIWWQTLSGRVAATSIRRPRSRADHVRPAATTKPREAPLIAAPTRPTARPRLFHGGQQRAKAPLASAPGRPRKRANAWRPRRRPSQSSSSTKTALRAVDHRGRPARGRATTSLTIIHDVTGIARRIAEIEPDVIVIDLENPNRDMLENMFQLSRAVKRPIAMFVDRSDQASIEAAVEAGVSAYVVDGLQAASASSRSSTWRSAASTPSRAWRASWRRRARELENRKLIDRAKGILMKIARHVGGRRLRAAAQDGDEPEPQDRRDRRRA